MNDLSYTDPPLHPRLRGDGGAALAAQWRDGGALHVDDVLDPGLAAELVTELIRLPLALRLLAEHEDLSWTCELTLSPVPDPHYAACLYRLAHFLDRDLPALAGTITGRRLVSPVRDCIHVWVFRKGAYVAAGVPLAPPGGLDVLLGLTGARWPADLGGHLELVDSGGRAVASHPPGWDTLDLIDGLGYRVPLVRTHVESLWVRTWLAPET